MKKTPPKQETVITDEIPGLRDFFATSIISGAIAAVGVPEEHILDDYVKMMAEFSYKMADAMLLEKYKNNTRH